NEADQLVALTKKGENQPFATYKYDDDNRRIEKNVNGEITRYFYDGDSINPLYETDGSGNVLRQYVYSIDGVRLAMKSQGQTVVYHYSPRGDVVAMTDANGQVVANYEYDAWGNVLKSDAKGIAADNPFGYAGYMYDKEIGMYYLIARYYNPEHGVFLSVDPDPGDEDDPVTQNGYTYADNNPVMMVDPDGHLAWFVPVAIHGARIAAPHVGRFVGKQLAKRAVKKPLQYKGTIGNKTSSYKDVTKPGSIVRNRKTNLSRSQFEKNLSNNGWKTSKSKDGNVSIMMKNGAKYIVRNNAKSTKKPTADYTPKGKKRATLKIRLKG
ncbi:RHS repeat domain-containing protein, partial [Bacillus cereus]